MEKPICIDLFCGLGGWAEGFLSEGYRVIGFDIEHHDYGTGTYPGEFVMQDVLTLHGSQFKTATCIVASPPCQAYSYRAMPWSRAKALPPPDNTLFEACFRIQREACEAAGRHIPMVVENVRGAQRWVGRSQWTYGSYHLWGDVPALMPIIKSGKSFQTAAVKVSGLNWSNHGNPGYKAKGFNVTAEQRFRDGQKGIPHAPTGHWTNPNENGIKQHGSGREWFAGEWKISRMTSSKSDSRKAASAQIAKIPFPLASHIARCFK